MPWIHVVKKGECLSSIADAYGLPKWQLIYEHPNNTAFKAKRPNPNLIYPGDELYIPDVTPNVARVPTDRRHIFVAEFAPTFLNIRVQDIDDSPFPNAPFELEAGSLKLDGSTDEDGWIHSRIPAWAEIGTLRVWPNPDDTETVIEWEMRLGHLDPIETVSGLKGRLNNLGYDCGEVNEEEDDRYTSAVMQFQTDNELLVDGIVGPQTRGALLKLHRV